VITCSGGGGQEVGVSWLLRKHEQFSRPKPKARTEVGEPKLECIQSRAEEVVAPVFPVSPAACYVDGFGGVLSSLLLLRGTRGEGDTRPASGMPGLKTEAPTPLIDFMPGSICSSHMQPVYLTVSSEYLS
jgi:hypothetical protein